MSQLRPKYRRLPIRVGPLLEYRLRELAEEEGWELADLLRVLILLATCPSFLTLERPERFDVIKAKNTLGRSIRLLGPIPAENRPYTIRSNRKTIVLVVHVPVKTAQLIQNYAEIVRKSRNEVCAQLLTQGLLLYFKAEHALFKTQLEMQEQRRTVDQATTNREEKPPPIAKNQQLPKPVQDQIK